MPRKHKAKNPKCCTRRMVKLWYRIRNEESKLKVYTVPDLYICPKCKTVIDFKTDEIIHEVYPIENQTS